MRAIIFDLDMTLIDTSILEPYRHRRDWATVYRMIPQCRLYDGMTEVFDAIRIKGIKVCIVSTAPSYYVERVCRYFKIPYDHIVGYHDAKPIKPHPAPFLKAISLLDIPKKEIISFGDRAIDIKASNSADISSVACYWGTGERGLLDSSQPTYRIQNPSEILNYV